MDPEILSVVLTGAGVLIGVWRMHVQTNNRIDGLERHVNGWTDALSRDVGEIWERMAQSGGSRVDRLTSTVSALMEVIIGRPVRRAEPVMMARRICWLGVVLVLATGAAFPAVAQERSVGVSVGPWLKLHDEGWACWHVGRGLAAGRPLPDRARDRPERMARACRGAVRPAVARAIGRRGLGDDGELEREDVANRTRDDADSRGTRTPAEFGVARFRARLLHVERGMDVQRRTRGRLPDRRTTPVRADGVARPVSRTAGRRRVPVLRGCSPSRSPRVRDRGSVAACRQALTRRR